MRYIAKDGLNLLVKIKFGSATKLAEHLGYSAKAIQQIVAKKKQPRYTTALDISNALDSEVESLFHKLKTPHLYARNSFVVILKGCDYTIQEILDNTGLSKQVFNVVKNGSTKVSQERANIISKALGLPVDDLFEWRYEE